MNKVLYARYPLGLLGLFYFMLRMYCLGVGHTDTQRSEVISDHSGQSQVSLLLMLP